FDSIERAGERLGLLHIPLHDLDIGKISDGSRLGGVAHQRPNLDALTGELPHRRLTVVSRCARNQDYGCSFGEEFLTPTLRISKFATDLAKVRIRDGMEAIACTTTDEAPRHPRRSIRAPGIDRASSSRRT